MVYTFANLVAGATGAPDDPTRSRTAAGVVSVSALPNAVINALGLGGDRIYHADAKGRDEWHTSCPRCGGKDRFVIRAIQEYPHWLVMCRQCSPDWVWLDQAAPSLRQELTPEQKQEYARRRAEVEAERERSTQKRLAEYTTGELWRELHRRMGEDNRAWWRKRGVDDEWQDYLQLGFTPEKTYRHDGQLFASPAYTIPYLRGATSITTQYRLTDPADPADKYRFEYGLPAAFYMATPTEPIGDKVIICEGAIKGMVTAIKGGLEGFTVLAVPAKRSWAGIAEQVRDCGRVWVALDPDGLRDAADLAKEIGKQARIVTLPAKIDDALNSEDLLPADLAVYLKHATII